MVGSRLKHFRLLPAIHGVQQHDPVSHEKLVASSVRSGYHRRQSGRSHRPRARRNGASRRGTGRSRHRSSRECLHSATRSRFRHDPESFDLIGRKALERKAASIRSNERRFLEGFLVSKGRRVEDERTSLRRQLQVALRTSGHEQKRDAGRLDGGGDSVHVGVMF